MALYLSATSTPEASLYDVSTHSIGSRYGPRSYQSRNGIQFWAATKQLKVSSAIALWELGLIRAVYRRDLSSVHIVVSTLQLCSPQLVTKQLMCPRVHHDQRSARLRSLHSQWYCTTTRWPCCSSCGLCRSWLPRYVHHVCHRRDDMHMAHLKRTGSVS